MRILFIITYLLMSNVFSKANNLTLTNISFDENGVTFDIAWDNSWHLSATNNWDAIWIFVKFQDCNTQNKLWNHLTLSNDQNVHSIGGNVLQIDAVSDGMGVFIRRISNGSGDITTTNVTLQYETPLASVFFLNMKVFGIEMVYIPEESFYVGDGSTGTPPNSQNSFGNNNSINPRLINSENALSANALEHINMGAPTRHLAIPADFPKGYAAFYCMKYEISQDQYVRFLNTLTASQQTNRTAVAINSPSGTFALASSSAKNRNFIKIITPSSGIPAIPAIYGVDLNDNNTYNEPDDGLTIACNYLTWNDLTAYLDWAALRPITELEFEKVARGPSSQGLPVIAEFAWGTTNITSANAGSINNAGQASEISTLSGNGLCANGSGNTAHGPLRVGFAATNSTNRQGAGSSYYGVLDLSGNVWEQCVHVGYNSGVGNGAVPIFNGSKGDGTLDTGGNADVSGWGLVGRSVVRGGNWFDGSSLCQISNRQFVTSSGTENGNRNPRTGGRGGR